MLRSLIEYTIKPHGHEDAEKELAEVMDLCSKYPLYVAESEKSEYDRLQHEIRLYNAMKSAAKRRNVDKVLRDSRALKCEVKKTINERRIASVRAGVPVSTSAGEDYRNAPQEVNIASPLVPPAGDPSQTTSSGHPNETLNTATNTSLPTPLAGVPSTSGPSLNPKSALPESHPIHAQVNLRQAVSLIRSGVSYQVDSMIMEGATVRFPTANINSPGSTGATVTSHGPQVAQDVPKPVPPRRAAGRRVRQQPSDFGGFLSGAHVSSGSIICTNSRVMGATLNVNSINSSGAVIHRRVQTRA